MWTVLLNVSILDNEGPSIIPTMLRVESAEYNSQSGRLFTKNELCNLQWSSRPTVTPRLWKPERFSTHGLRKCWSEVDVKHIVLLTGNLQPALISIT